MAVVHEWPTIRNTTREWTNDDGSNVRSIESRVLQLPWSHVLRKHFHDFSSAANRNLQVKPWTLISYLWLRCDECRSKWYMRIEHARRIRRQKPPRIQALDGRKGREKWEKTTFCRQTVGMFTIHSGRLTTNVKSSEKIRCNEEQNASFQLRIRKIKRTNIRFRFGMEHRISTHLAAWVHFRWWMRMSEIKMDFVVHE